MSAAEPEIITRIRPPVRAWIYADAEAIPGEYDRTLLVDVNADSDHPGFHDEVFGPIYLTTALAGADAGDFLTKAVAFANERLHGNLGANILIHPQTAEELGPRLEQVIADLRYGCIGVNVWSAFAFLSPRAAWGAYPGNTATDIQSGTGVVHNSLLFDRAQSPWPGRRSAPSNAPFATRWWD